MFLHDTMLRHLAISDFKLEGRGPSEDVGPLWEALFAAASADGSGGPPLQLSGSTLWLYTASQKALDSLKGLSLQQGPQQQDGDAASTRTTPAPAPAPPTCPPQGLSDSQEVSEAHLGGPQGASRDREEKRETLCDLLMSKGVRDFRQILLPFFAVAPLAPDGRGVDLAYLCMQRLLACFAVSSKW